MWQESRFVPPVGAAGGVCPAGGGLWLCLAHGQGHGGVVTARSWGSGLCFAPSVGEAGAKVFSGSCAAPSVSAFPGEPCTPLSLQAALRGGQQDSLGTPGPPEGERISGKHPEALGTGVSLHRRL